MTALEEQIRRTELRIEQQRLSICEQQVSAYQEVEIREFQKSLEFLASLRKRQAALCALPPPNSHTRASIAVESS
jgi:TolA-binding protein